MKFIFTLTAISMFTLLSCGEATNKKVKEEKSISKSDSTELISKEVKKSYLGYNGMSREFLDLLKAGKSTDDIAKRYASVDIDKLATELDSDDKKKAFWINTYNAFIQHILIKHPERYEDRNEFFKRDQINIAGITMSFDEIEHGIIRSSKWKLGGGYLPRLSPDHVRKLKVDSTDGRIHLALNCGAKSCPEIVVLNSESADKELDIISKRYLKKTTTMKGEIVTVTPLMSWFRGDFNGKKGIKEDYLEKYGLVNSTKEYDIEFGEYDWTLDLGNYTTI